ncbi:hypothetical protein SAMN04489844_1219 [Nocardioides exalbidus]|uniref:DUF1772 domain-containing protein n=1 Tax=Nocardioides exalbidus TaxID=402596 RepID=A0A1H4MTT9_9ACTN|nr:hypothetical protein [Nocardioides exalbidus]SEB86580.1 hypothetical protein SAMN04489844_1219 [Nocardioides exalbidus]
MNAGDPAPWLLLAASLHAGFQLTVTLVVYPALVDVAPEAWTRAHDRHSRRIAPLAVVLYAALVLLLGWTILAEPGSPGTWVALAGGVVSVLATALAAAPLHGRLSLVPPAERRVLLERLVRADRVRTVGALVCLVGAAWVSWPG